MISTWGDESCLFSKVSKSYGIATSLLRGPRAVSGPLAAKCLPIPCFVIYSLPSHGESGGAHVRCLVLAKGVGKTSSTSCCEMDPKTSLSISSPDTPRLCKLNAHSGMLSDPSGAECTKIAHRRSLAIFTADKDIARNSAARSSFTHLLRRRNRGSLAIFFAEQIAHLGASKNRDFLGSVKNRRRSRRESRDFGALSSGVQVRQRHIELTWEFTC